MRTAVKSAARRRMPTKPVENPFVKKKTNFIKELCVALVKFDRIQTTLHKALQLKAYGELVCIKMRTAVLLYVFYSRMSIQLHGKTNFKHFQLLTWTLVQVFADWV